MNRAHIAKTQIRCYATYKLTLAQRDLATIYMSNRCDTMTARKRGYHR